MNQGFVDNLTYFSIVFHGEQDSIENSTYITRAILGEQVLIGDLM